MHSRPDEVPDMKWTTKRKLIASEVASFAAGGIVILYYWTNASYEAVGIVFTVEYFVSIINTYLWFVRTDEDDPDKAHLKEATG